MTDPIAELKTRAEILHKRIQAQSPRHLSRLRVLDEFRRLPEEQLRALGPDIRRRDCLSVVAAELGFPNWPSAKAAISGEGQAAGFGTLLYPARGGGLNRWYKQYEEAAAVRAACNGYLLAYQRHFVVVERDHIESLGLDPADPDWAAIGFDWVRPDSLPARTRLYGKLIARLPREAED